MTARNVARGCENEKRVALQSHFVLMQRKRKTVCCRVKGGIRPHSLPIFNFSELCGENDQNKLGRIYT